jgi:hypothetical protein
MRHRLRCCFTGEHRPSCQHFIDNNTERPDVGAAVDGLTFRLFGRHVGRCAQYKARLRGGKAQRGRVRSRTRSRVFTESFGQPEIQNLQTAIGSQLDICRL